VHGEREEREREFGILRQGEVNTELFTLNECAHIDK
jgi:hypothetical protein